MLELVSTKDSMFTLKCKQDTFLKQSRAQASTLPDNEKQAITAGTELHALAFRVEEDHLKVTFDQTFKGLNTWYAFAAHFTLTGVPLKFIKLEVPYKNQRDNGYNPGGSCNVTSIAMCLAYLGVKQKTNESQFEDELYAYCLNNGLSRHSPQDLAQVVRAYGCKDTFTVNGTIDQVKKWLDGGNPVVTHGYFASFGHIVVLVGYDEKGFLVHDPYGEWYPGGYDRNVPGNDRKGEYVHYSYEMIQRTCMTDGQFWVHFISK